VQIEYPNEPIAVEARRDEAGRPVPLAFQWRGQRYLIRAWGRQHTEEAEGKRYRHFLVQTDGQETWELRYEESSGEWRLLRRWGTQHLAV
jgi:hypothetical protein